MNSITGENLEKKTSNTVRMMTDDLKSNDHIQID